MIYKKKGDARCEWLKKKEDDHDDDANNKIVQASISYST